MTSIYAKFASQLRSKVNGQFEAAFGADAAACTPADALAAGICEDDVTEAVAAALGVAFIPDLTDQPVSRVFCGQVPISFARRHGVVGLTSPGSTGDGRVAIPGLAQLTQVQALSQLLGEPLEPVFAPRKEILRIINLAYQQATDQAQEVISRLEGEELLDQFSRVGNEDLLDAAGKAPVIKLVNLMLFEAVKRQASDVHVQPYDEKLLVRMRIDGVLHDVLTPPKGLQNEIISRIKVMGGMNIAERRIAQDGRATVEVGERLIDLRISTLPTSFGERAVIRLLDKSVRLYTLSELGMPPDVLEPFRRQIHADHGIILVTGPTGSGKTTTLYAALGELNSTTQNILTLEDPIEYRLEGISQTQVSEKKGMTFAGGLRHVLRQDPDIIMVGEIRDRETAAMAIQSALTGHLVFSTLHTNDAAGAVARLLDLGVEPYLLASGLLGVMAQRLVRCLCPACRQAYQPSAEDLARWQLKRSDLGGECYRAGGCDECMQTGYRQRHGIFEFLQISEAIRELILNRAKASSIKSVALAGGMTTLRADGLDKVRRGITTMDEVMKVTGRDEF